jgi:hypothetical protein
MGGERKCNFFESLSLYLVIRLRSRKLGEPVRRGIEGDRERLPIDCFGEVADEEEDEESSEEDDEELDEESESEDESELDDEEEEELES